MLKRGSVTNKMCGNSFKKVRIEKNPLFNEPEYYERLMTITKEICSGCSACKNVCPTRAIELKEDDLTGFKLIEIDAEKCVNCGQCIKVCPHETIKLHNLSTQKKYALRSLDENVLKKSSSGGAFTHITLPLLEQGWKVVGVKWNKEWHAEYAIADTVEEWEKFRKSKYMQADMGDLFPRIREMLDNGEKIVFSGVPCHVSGLLNYLGKEYDNLLTIDLLCGALHSPKIWDEWYEYEGLDKSTFVDIDMRYKCNNGAGNHTIHIEKTNGQVHDIMTATTPIWSLTYCGRKMAMNVCHECKYRPLDRVSDITISDMHNAKDIAPDFLDKRNNNVSSVLCNTLKGEKIINSLSLNDVQIKEIEGIVRMPQNFKRRNLEKSFKDLNENGITFPKIKEETPYDIAICGGTFNANFGATLTYYALYRYLELLGNKVIMLPPFDKEFKGGMLKENVFEKYCDIAPNYFKSKPVNFNNLANTFILGSDQMWNPKCALYTKLGLKTFLNYIKNNKSKISYSVSTGGKIFPGTINDDNKYDEIKRLLSKFDAISCREQDGCDLIKEHCSINADHTIDPVFLLPTEEYEKLIKESKIELPKGEYGCYYAIGPSEKHLDFFHNLNKKLGIEDVVIGCGQPNNYKNYSVNLPNEKFVNPINAQDWLKYIKNAKYVVTTSFHCVCFCIMFNIPFICLRDIKNIRINWILGSTNLRDNYLKELDANKAIEIINKPINHLHYLNNFIEYSKNWLNEKIVIKPNKKGVDDATFIGETTNVVHTANKIFGKKMITNLGGKCFGHFMLKHINGYTDKFTPLYCPFGAMRFNNGFSDIYKVFDGTFYNEIFNMPDEIKKDELIRRDGVSIKYFHSKTLRIMHTNMNSKKDVKKLKNRYEIFFNTLSKTNNIIFLYSLCEFDVDKTVEEIKETCDKLKKYIDINNLYIIGSVANKEKNSPWWFDYQNSNFKEVFGERYIEIEGSNADNMKNCTKKLIKKLKM